MTRTIEEIEQDIARLTNELSLANQALSEFNRLTIDKKIAILLHDKTCISNHADQCFWHYEIKNSVHDFNGGEHRSYLIHSQTIIKRLDKILKQSIPVNYYEVVKAVIER